MSLVRIGALVRTADELLSTAQRLIDDETIALERDPSVDVACRPNCNHCCDHAVGVTAAEHRAIAAAMTELDRGARDRIEARARAITKRMREEAIDPRAAGFASRYYAMAEPCPLLVDGACAVRAQRPLVCRDYLMSSAQSACADRTLEHAVRIRRRRRVPAAFAEVSAGFGETGTRLLADALLSVPPAPVEASRPGPRLAATLSRPRR